MQYKTCTKCGNELPATAEYFYRDKNRKDGLYPQCKECRTASIKKYSENNKEKISERKKEYYEKVKSEPTYKEKVRTYQKEWVSRNSEKLKAYRKQYRNNSDHRLEYEKEYYKKNKDRISSINKALYCKNKIDRTNQIKKWREQNKNRIAAKSKEWYQNNKAYLNKYANEWRLKNLKKCRENERIQSAKRRTLKAQLPATLTAEQWRETTQLFNNKCAYCGETHKLEQDHFIALTKGGGYTFDNIIPACRSCNCSKNNRDFFEWYPQYEHYSKERETAILEFLDLAKEEAIEEDEEDAKHFTN